MPIFYEVPAGGSESFRINDPALYIVHIVLHFPASILSTCSGKSNRILPADQVRNVLLVFAKGFHQFLVCKLKPDKSTVQGWYRKHGCLKRLSLFSCFRITHTRSAESVLQPIIRLITGVLVKLALDLRDGHLA
jgi:hypothetical protein